ncbi:MAG: ABC transporter ATP-binding protein [Gemmatimonadaceae bacterium]
MATPARSDPLLTVVELRASFATDDGVAKAVDGVSFAIDHGETVGLVGESGCGKSVTALSLMRLIRPYDLVDSGHIVFEGRDLACLPEAEMRAIRGNRMAMIFQEPMTALNPVFTVGDQVSEVARIHDRAPRKVAWDRAVELLTRVGIGNASERARQYPHQLSGGMRQRVMIAMALVMRPALLIADEPTTALDVTIQAQILELLAELQRTMGMSLLIITHDLGVVAEVASRVLVMYAGQIVEECSVRDMFASAHHPYSEGLLRAMPRLGHRRDRLEVIAGSVPSPTAWPTGCRFRDRCRYAWDRCETEPPSLYHIGANHLSRCHLAVEPERRNSPHDPLAKHSDGIASR